MTTRMFPRFARTGQAGTFALTVGLTLGFLAVEPARGQCAPDQTVQEMNGELDDFDGVVGITQPGTIVTCVGVETRQVTTTFDPDVITPGPVTVTVNIAPGATLGSSGFIPVLLTGLNNTINNQGTVTVNGDELLSLAIAATGGTIDNMGTVNATGFETGGLGIQGASAEVRNGGMITITGVDVGGIELVGNDGMVTNSGDIITNGSLAIGISGTGTGAKLMNPGTIAVNSDTSIGMSALGRGAIVTNDNSIVTNAAQALGMGAVGDDVTVTNAAGATVETRRDQSFGMFIGLQTVPPVGLPAQAADPAQGTLTNDGNVITDGDGSDGIHGLVTSATINNNATVNVQGDNAFAVDIVGSALTTTISNADTILAGVELLGALSPTRNSGGIRLSGRGNISNAAGASLTAYGEAAIGIWNNGADGSAIGNLGNLRVDSSFNTAAGRGIDVAGNNVKVQNGANLPATAADSATLFMIGDNSTGIRTRGTGAAVSNSAQLTLAGTNNRAIDLEIQGNGSYWVDNDGVINVNDDAINPGGGSNSVGIYVRNADTASNQRLDRAQNPDAFCVAGGPTGAQILNCGTINLATAQNAAAMHVEGTADSFIENQASIIGMAAGQKGIVINKATTAPDSDGQVNVVTNFKTIDLAGAATRGLQVAGNGNLVFNGTGVTNFAFVPGIGASVTQAIDRQTARDGPFGTEETRELTALGMIRVNGSGAIGIDVLGNGNLLGNRLDFIELENPPVVDPNLPPDLQPGFVGFSEIRATGANSIGVRFTGTGNVLDNEGIIAGDAYSIFGSPGKDIVQNQNRLIGNVDLGAGNDTFLQLGSGENIEGTVHAGEGGGRDNLIVIASTAPRALEDAGTVQRTVIDGNQYLDFETLVISNGAAERVNGAPVPPPPRARAFLRNELVLSAADGTEASQADIKATELIFENDGRLVADLIKVGLGSKLSGNGSVGRKVFNLGEVESTIEVDAGAIFTPGNSPGTFEFAGNVQFDGTFELEFAGTGPGEFDVIDVLGDLDLGSSAAFELIFTDGFAPKAADSFEFLFAENLTGDIDAVALTVSGLLPGFDFDLGLNGGRLTLTALTDTSPVPVPAAAWLFLSALAAAACARRSTSRRDAAL